MKRLVALLPLLSLTACSGSLPAQFVGAESSTYQSFAPVVARDVAAGHVGTQYLYDIWGKNVAAAVAATQPAAGQ